MDEPKGQGGRGFSLFFPPPLITGRADGWCCYALDFGASPWSSFCFTTPASESARSFVVISDPPEDLFVCDGCFVS